jgi:hypothetical protein
MVFSAATSLAQMADDMSAPAPVQGFSSATTSATRVAVQNPKSAATTASLSGKSMLEKAPARLETPPKTTYPATGKPSGPTETRVLETGIDAKDFLQIVGSSLGKNLTAKQVDSTHVAITGTSEPLRRVTEVSEQIRSAMRRPAKQLRLRVALLTDRAESDAGAGETPTAIGRGELSRALPGYELAQGDVDGLGLPEQLYKLADLTAPASGGGESRAQLTDRLSLLYELRPTLAGDYEVALNLAEKEKGTNPFDATVGRIIFANHFRAGTARPVVLGVTNPGRTLMLLIRLQAL